MEANTEKTQITTPIQSQTENKTKKQKKAPKPRPIRDESAHQTAFELLENLKSKKAISDVDDRRIVEKALTQIEALKESGIGYKEIYNVLRNGMDLRIGFTTFLTYVQKAKGGTARANGKQRLVILMPEDRAENMKTLTDRIADGANIVCLSFDDLGELAGRLDFGEIPDVKVDLSN